MTTPTHTAADVVRAISAAGTAAMAGDLGDVQVLDAVDPIQAYAEKSLTVGGTWDPDDQAFVTDQTVTVTIEETGAGRLPVETTTVECIAYSGSGDDDLPGHRTTVGRIVAALGAQLHTVTDIGGASARARIADQQWAQGGDSNGTLVMAMLTVEVLRLP